MVFHAELGSQGERVERLVALAGALVPHVPGRRPAAGRARRAAGQGRSGHRHGRRVPRAAGHHGRPLRPRRRASRAAVAAAIREHYAPKGPDDRCPTAPASVAVALADKLDTLVGFFAAGIRPTGSKDPFALRRAGARRHPADPRERPAPAAARGVRGGARAAMATGFAGRRRPVGRADSRFFADRLKVHLRERGVRHDLIAAVVRGRRRGRSRPPARPGRGAAARSSTARTARNLLTAYRRASNIVAHRGEEGRPALRRPARSPALLVEPAERGAVRGARDAPAARSRRRSRAEDYRRRDGGAGRLARHRSTRSSTAVMVNATEPDLRANRLLLLGQIRSALRRGGGLLADRGRGAGRELSGASRAEDGRPMTQVGLRVRRRPGRRHGAR